MEDLIKRSDAIEAIELVDWYHQNRNKDIVSGANSREHQAWYKAEDIYKALEGVPTAKPKRGEWIIEKTCNNNYNYRCSYCNWYERHDYPDVKPYNYCPNCGADMQEVHNE